MKSITIRPYLTNFNKYKAEWRDKLIKKFIKDGGDFIIATEKDSHFQIGWENLQRSNNLRRTIVHLLGFQGEDDNERRQWLKIKEHNNDDYLLGYCQKEGVDIESNVDSTHLKICLNNYNELKHKKDEKHKWVCTSLNELFKAAWQYGSEHDCCHLSIKVITGLMVGEDLIPLSLACKVTNKLDSYWTAHQYNMDNREWVDILDKLVRMEKDEHLL